MLLTPAEARVFLSVDEALELAFPGCQVERTTVYLDAAQKARVEELAGEPVASAIVYPYVATCDGEAGGTAYFDVHRVRTLPETVMIVVSPDATVSRVEVLSFDEPTDYLPRDAWYAQFQGRKLDDRLALKRGIQPTTGATLTAQATTAAARRVLALHKVLSSAGQGKEGGGE